MATPTELSLMYLKFLELAQAARQVAGMPPLDAVEDQVLGFCGRRWQAGHRLTVVEAMNSLSDVSASTVQRRLKALRAKGLLRVENAQDDSRFKCLAPTELTQRYFAALGQCVVKAQSG